MFARLQVRLLWRLLRSLLSERVLARRVRQERRVSGVSGKARREAMRFGLLGLRDRRITKSNMRRERLLTVRAISVRWLVLQAVSALP